MKRQKFIVLSLFFILFGCEDKSISESGDNRVYTKAQIEQLEMVNEQLERQIADMEKKNEEEKEVFTITMNLAVHLFNPINNNDLAYITSISSSNVQVNMEESMIYLSDYNYKINDRTYL